VSAVAVAQFAPPPAQPSLPGIPSLPREVEALDARAILALALERLGRDRLPIVSSFGPEGIVILDLVRSIEPRPRVLTLDTGRLHAQTYDLIEQVSRALDLEIEVVFPDADAVARMTRERGVNLFYRSVDDRLRCCAVRKVDPLRQALRDAWGWVTGVRRDQTSARARTPKIGLDLEHGGIWKVAPLADWTEARVWAHIRSRGLPYHPLHDQGYPSIGCAPCTRAIAPGEDPRAGRWWWETDGSRECGLHLRTAADSGSDS
jgi:phosphoadenosine phosphosulfate reductase